MEKESALEIVCLGNASELTLGVDGPSKESRTQPAHQYTR